MPLQDIPKETEGSPSDACSAPIAQAIRTELTHGTASGGSFRVSDASRITTEQVHDLYAVGGSKWRTEIRIPAEAIEDKTVLEHALSFLLGQESMALPAGEPEPRPEMAVGFWVENDALFLDVAYLIEGSRNAFALADRIGQPYVYSFARNEMQAVRTGLGKRDDWGPDSWVTYNMQRIGRWGRDAREATEDNTEAL